jgi:streptomycin 3"-adenylyltransferase
MVAGIDGLLSDLDDDTRTFVLTLARIWCTLATGRIRTKDDAAAWALERLPADLREPLARARTIYLDGGEERWDDLAGGLRLHVDAVGAEIRRLAAEEARAVA